MNSVTSRGNSGDDLVGTILWDRVPTAWSALQNRISNGGKKRLVARNSLMAYKLMLIFPVF
jgi:hypothetical protein